MAEERSRTGGRHAGLERVALARVFSACLVGVEAALVPVEVDVSQVLPTFATVGLPDPSVRESRERVRTAVRNSGFGLVGLGYRDGEQFVIGVRFTQGDIAALPAAARDLVQSGVDLIFAIDVTAARAAQLATSRDPRSSLPPWWAIRSNCAARCGHAAPAWSSAALDRTLQCLAVVGSADRAVTTPAETAARPRRGR
jgi:hypothetical protein